MNLGIDIVDLHDPKIRDRSERSMKLIQHEDDQLIDHPHIFWLLWSAKEAIFKCEREPKNFSPTSISVQLADKEEGISFTTERFDGKVIITDEYILAIVRSIVIAKAILKDKTAIIYKYQKDHSISQILLGYWIYPPKRSKTTVL